MNNYNDMHKRMMGEVEMFRHFEKDVQGVFETYGFSVKKNLIGYMRWKGKKGMLVNDETTRETRFFLRKAYFTIEYYRGEWGSL